ncbi:DUF1652 domain-containing protein [Pseudomonas sp. H11T01]|uniref:DUF1652 domain-containing protein n=1 Tax=Pseudomonas sp. H11T01 TaxID=3402749 RepID=UPI003ABF0A67
MISPSRLRGYLEQSFLPLSCDCGLCPGPSLTVRLYDAASGRVDLVVTGLRLEKLATVDDVEALIEELRYELQSNSLGRSGVGE